MPRDLLLLHGAGLGAWIWDRVVPHLLLPALALDLPGRGDGTPLNDVTLEQSIQLVVDHLGNDTAIVGHSFSAMIALAAATRKRAQVIAFGGVTPETGRNFMSIVPFPQRLLVGLMLRRAKNGIALPQGLVRKQYCNDLDRETTELVMRNLTREAPHLYLDPVEWSPHAPAYVKLLRDASASRKEQDKMIARMHASRVESLRAGHLAMLAQPQETAVVLNRLSGR
ncbi:MAG TPA: alpha/beta hydrolase [Thermoanaerobaculia bacterium]|jgi:pimeloyl-ACP methyl ester carboxylesterase